MGVHYASQIWTEVLALHPTPSFSRKAVYARWAQQDRLKWKRDDDEVKSAQILLEEARAGHAGNGMYSVAPVKLPEEDGFQGIAFALPEVIRKWGGRIRELALDSACM